MTLRGPQTPTPNPSPAEVGCIRLRQLKMPNPGKPEFGWGGERTEIAALLLAYS